jgi:energy-coupling factor transporter ATP-binding protein EcfA2
MAELEVRNLTKRFGKTVAVDDLSFSVEAGRVTGFLGPNGAGKTTTMRALLGLVRPSAGEALVDGRPPAEMREPLRTIGAALEATAFHPSSGRNHLRVLAARTPPRRHRRLLSGAGGRLPARAARGDRRGSEPGCGRPRARRLVGWPDADRDAVDRAPRPQRVVPGRGAERQPLEETGVNRANRRGSFEQMPSTPAATSLFMRARSSTVQAISSTRASLAMRARRGLTSG